MMNDKNLMENILLLEKGVCDLYLHGTIESPTENVRGAFQSALNASLKMQDSVYGEMTSRGWYTTTQAPRNKVQNLKQQFSGQ